MTDDEAVLRGSLREELVAAMQRIPEIAGRELTLTALSGGITNRNFLVEAAGTTDRWVIRLAGNDTYLLGISREEIEDADEADGMTTPAPNLPAR